MLIRVTSHVVLAYEISCLLTAMSSHIRQGLVREDLRHVSTFKTSWHGMNLINFRQSLPLRPVMSDSPNNIVQSWMRNGSILLMFAMIAMRVDISYAVTSVAHSTANPGMPNWVALVPTFQYLKGTSDVKLTYFCVCDTHALLLYEYSHED